MPNYMYKPSIAAQSAAAQAACAKVTDAIVADGDIPWIRTTEALTQEEMDAVVAALDAVPKILILEG